jgi:hypothetical protein
MSEETAASISRIEKQSTRLCGTASKKTVSFSVTAYGNLTYCLVQKMFKPTLYFATVNKYGIIQMFSAG